MTNGILFQMAIEILRRALDAEDGRYGLTVDLNTSTSYSNNSVMQVGRSPTMLPATPELVQGDSCYSNSQEMYNYPQLRKI